MKFYVAGVRFHKFHTIVNSLNEGDSVQLVLEPSNKYDKFAVRVEVQNTMLGYVPKILSETISNKISSGVTLTAKINKLSLELEPWNMLKVEIKEEPNV